MKKQERLTNNINNNKELLKAISKNEHYSVERFIQDATDYIKAIKSGRMVNVIGSVSASGMSRTIKFSSCEKSKYDNSHYFRNYFQFFLMLGYTPANSRDHFFRIGGCGMDMIFHTNYTIIHRLHSLGFISKKECSYLAQQTPNTL